MAKKILSALELNVNNSMVDTYAMEVIRKLQENGYDGYIVGGGIRDLLLNKTPKDFDVVTNATPETVRKIFKRNSIIIGRRFKIVHVVYEHQNYEKLINNRPIVEKHIIEISTYRSLKVHDSSLNEFGRIMVDNNYGKQSDDGLRRDFTINALYYDPIKEIVVDYHNGIKDLQKKSLKMIGDPVKRFIEDPVRVLRAIRLSVKLGLNIDADTLIHLTDAKALLVNENRGRLFEEMLKILLSGKSRQCINKLAEFQLPLGVFPLFDKIFFGKLKEPLALRILDKTDERVNIQNDVSTIFILSGLMWHMVNKNWQKLLYEGGSPRQALCDAILLIRSYAHNLGITRNTFNAVCDIWMLQFEFENPILKKLTKLTKNSRFRQGFYLYNLRMELGEVDPKLNIWWTEFLELSDDEDKIIYIEQLKKIFNPITKPKKRKRRKSKALNDSTNNS